MHPLLRNNQFLFKEQIGMFKAANNYDVFHPETGEKILEAREPHLGWLTKLFRFTDYKRMTPFQVELSTPDRQNVLTVKRGFSLFLSKVEVFDERQQPVGFFKQKLFSIGGKFDIFDAQENKVCSLKGSLTGWDFRFVRQDQEIAQVSKKWSGLGKELFTSADNYMLSIDDGVAGGDGLRLLIFGAVICIDMVLKE